jgi:hypothetical protein
VFGWGGSAQADTFSASSSTLSVPDGIGSGVSAIAEGDVNGDARPDLVTADPGSSTLSFLLNGGGGSFSAGPDLGAVSPQGLAVADLNGDGKPDLVYTDPVDNLLVVALADASGLNYNNETGISTGNFPTGVALGDLDGDGHPDIVVTNSQDNTVMIFLASSAGVYPSTPTTTFTAGTFPTSVTIADLNGDGQPDLVVTNRNGGSVTLFTQSSGSYTSTTVSTGSGSGPTSAAVADLNGDGRQDIAVADGTDGAGGNSVTLLLKDTGDAGYTSSTVAAGRSPWSVVTGDFNGDGRPDIAVANRLGNTVTVFLKDATGSTYTPSTLAAAGGPVSLVAGDFNGDGRPDLATANTFAGNVTLLLNTTPKATGTITGTVTNAAGAGVPNICVYPFVAATGGRTADAAACTDASGAYTLSVGATGSYNLVFYESTGTYVTQWYNGAAFEGAATPVPVTLGLTTSGINAVLTTAAAAASTAITGTVKDAAGNPVSGICVYPFSSATGNRTADPAACTNASGAYTLTVPAGSYNVVFFDSLGRYATQWYNGVAFEGQATAVVVGATTTTGINATVAP